MKQLKFIPMIVIIASLLLSACSISGSSLAAPAAAIVDRLTGQQVSVAQAPTATAMAVLPANTIADAASLQNAYEAVYQKVNPSVVTIKVSARVTSTGFRSGSGDQVVPTGEGSGFVWDTQGHIVTNNHVVDGAEKITVTFADGSSYDARITGADPNTDLAVVQVSDAPASVLIPVTVADSTQVKVGQLVVAIGNPYGLSNTMTTGIVSAIARSIRSNVDNSQSGLVTPSFSIPDVIQTDAAINPGNSGGVLVDITGALIGVPSQIELTSGTNSGIGFAIPSAIVSQVVPQLIDKGSASHAYLGISGATVTADVINTLNLKAGQQGILVATVVEGGPAANAGLQPATVDSSGAPTAAGDIITAVDGKPLTRFEDLVSYLYSNTQPGQKVELTVMRDGNEAKVTVTLGTQPTK